MMPPETDDRRDHRIEEPDRRPWWYAVRPGRSLVLFPVIVGGVWGGFVILLGALARLSSSGEDRPSWGEIAGSAAINALAVLGAALILSVGVRLIGRRREPAQDTGESARAGESWLTQRSDATFLGRPVMPTTAEGRVALLVSLFVFAPFLAGPAMLGAAVFFVLALRRGDRGLLLVVPGLVTLFFLAFVILEFTVGHD